MEDLNGIIKEKASKKLHHDIREFLEGLNRNPLWECLDQTETKITHRGGSTLRSLFWMNTENWAYKTIREKMLPKYVERESIAFYQKVERFQKEYEDLFEEPV